MRISDWSSDVCSSDLVAEQTGQEQRLSSAGSAASDFWQTAGIGKPLRKRFQNGAEFRIAYITQTLSHVAGHGLQHFGRRTPFRFATFHLRSEEHTSELQSLMRMSYAAFCLKKKTNILTNKQQS